MVAGSKLTKHGSEYFSDASLYLFVIGALQFVTINRPEISFVVNKVCQFMSSLFYSHWITQMMIDPPQELLSFLAPTLSLSSPANKLLLPGLALSRIILTAI
ncbi:hypothetical protein CR513_16909, partial [Mucuna pruriens]